jgi:hypothetical protein
MFDFLLRVFRVQSFSWLPPAPFPPIRSKEIEFWLIRKNNCPLILCCSITMLFSPVHLKSFLSFCDEGHIMVCISLQSNPSKGFANSINCNMGEFGMLKVCGILCLPGREEMKCTTNIPVTQFVRSTTARLLLVKIVLVAIAIVDLWHSRRINILLLSNLMVGLTKGFSGHHSCFFGHWGVPHNKREVRQ